MVVLSLWDRTTTSVVVGVVSGGDVVCFVAEGRELLDVV